MYLWLVLWIFRLQKTLVTYYTEDENKWVGMEKDKDPDREKDYTIYHSDTSTSLLYCLCDNTSHNKNNFV